MASEKNINQKIKEIEELSEKIKKAKVVLLTDYRGINVEDITKLREKLRQAKTEYSVIKNNITLRAMQKCNIEGLEESLKGPTAVIIGYEDYLQTTKTIYDYAKDHDFYKIKDGIIEGKVIQSEEIMKIAQLPSREVLMAKLAGALLGNITKLAVALKQVSEQKEQTA